MRARLLFSTNNQIGSAIVRAVTWSRFSHVDIVADGGRVIGALALGGGVVEYDLRTRLAESTRFAMYEAPCEMAAVVAQARKRIGAPYDWLGVLGIGLHRDWQSEADWFCSELAAKCFLDAGTPLLNPQLQVGRITPEDLIRSPLLRLVAGWRE